VDKNGLMVPRTDNRIRFSIQGPGDIVATDDGDATSHESFQSPERAAFNGLALVIVRTHKGQTGTIRLKCTSPDLTSAEINLSSTAVGKSTP
jgi:beta-galactosidase